MRLDDKYVVVAESAEKIETIKSLVHPVLSQKWKFYAVKPEYFSLVVKNKKLMFDDEGTPLIDINKGLYNFKTSAMGADKVFICTNPDDAGEALAYHLQDVVLKHSEASIIRVPLEAITKENIDLYMKSTERVDLGTAEAQIAREVIDTEIELGYKPTVRNIGSIVESKSHYIPLNFHVFAILRLLVKVERERRSFMPIKTMYVKCEICNGAAYAKSLKFTLREDAIKHIEKIRKAEGELTLETDFAHKTKIINSYRPFTTVPLLKELFKKMKLSPKDALDKLMFLYEKGIITYPVTDRLSLNRQFAEQLWKEARKQGFKVKENYQQYYDSGTGEIIRPTQILHPEDTGLQKEYLEIYKIVWDRTLSTQMKPTIVIDQDIDFLTSDEDQLLLTAKGRIIDREGATHIEATQEITEKTAKILGDMTIEEETTQPPPRYNYATLIDALNEDNIWRSMVTPQIVESMIKERMIIVTGEGELKSTRRGELVYSLVSAITPDLVDPVTVEQLEDDLQSIKDSEVDYREVIKEYQGMLTPYQFSSLKKVRVKYPKECPQCQFELTGGMNYNKREPYVKCGKCEWWNYIDFDADGNIRISSKFQQID